MKRYSRADWAKKWKPYKSKLEHDFAESMKSKGIAFEYEYGTLQYKKRVVGGVCDDCDSCKTSQKRKYLPDFRLDSGVIIETKGNFTPTDRGKMLAVKKDHPELDIRLVFSQNNKLYKKKDERYSDWCEKHGYTYAIGTTFPEAWLQPATEIVRELGPEYPTKRKRRRRRRQKASRRGPLQKDGNSAD